MAAGLEDGGDPGVRRGSACRTELVVGGAWNSGVARADEDAARGVETVLLGLAAG